jgi:uncharacterized membrane protein YfcA
VTVALPLVLFALAFCGAFVSGLVGVGGAIVMIPLLYYVPPLLGAGELTIKEVAGLSMTQVLAAALVGAWSHGRHAFVHRRLALIGGSAMAAGALLGALLSSHVPGRALLATFAVMSTLALLLMFVSPAEPTAADGDPAAVPLHRASAAGLPGVIGLAAGVVGAGGAFLLVPVMVGVMRIPMRLSIGTSLAMVGMSAIAGFLGKAVTGQVPLWPAATVVLGSLSGAPLGGRVSRRVPVTVLRAVLVGIIVVVMLRVWLDVATQ